MKQVTVSRRLTLHHAAICLLALLGVVIVVLTWPAILVLTGSLLLCLIGVAAALVGRIAGIAIGGLGRGLTIRALTLGRFTVYRRHAEPAGAHAGFAVFETGGVRFAAGANPPGQIVSALAWALAGGPLGIAFTGVAGTNLGRLVAGPGWVSSCLSGIGLSLLVVAALDLAPLRFGRFVTDGQRILTIQRDPLYHADNVQVQHWMEVMGSATAPGNWPEPLIAEQERALACETAARPHERMRAYFAGMMLYYHYADRRDWPEATHVIARAVDLPRPPRKLAVTANLDSLQSLHLALRGQNPGAARFFLNRATIAATGSPVLRDTALAAILLAEHNPVDAIERAASVRRGQPTGDGATPVDRLVASWSDEIIELAHGGSPVTAPAFSLPPPRDSVLPLAPAPLLPMVVAWDPGVPSDRRAFWLWRNPRTADLLT